MINYSLLKMTCEAQLLLILFQIEIGTGKFPYPKWNSVFEQLTQVVNGDPPQLRDDGRRCFTIQFINFVNTW